MMKTAQQKIKLLYLWELLKKDSGESRPLKTTEILEALEKVGISCDRRTLSRDIGDLNQWGFEVMNVLCGHEKGYYVADRLFSTPELRILMDGVESSQLITEKKSRELKRKLASMGGSYESERLRNHSLFHNRRKYSNEVIYYTIDALEKAIWENKKISFFYYKLNEKREKVYDLDKCRFVVDPIGLTMNGDRHYLAALDPRREGLSVFRIDRMEDVTQEQEDRSPECVVRKAEAEAFANQAVKMHSGKACDVTLQFVSEMTPHIMDRFGEQIEIRAVDDGLYEITAPVMISPTFWGWLFQYQDNIRLTHPQSAVQEAREFIKKLPYFDCEEETL